MNGSGEADSRLEMLTVFLDGNARDLSRNASTSDATELRKRLLEQAAGLDKLCQSRTLGEFTPMLEMELGYRYAQLALLDEKENPASAGEYMTKAEQIFCSLGWRDCSRARLRTATEHRLAHLKRFSDKGGEQ